jgi:hypothetical protein
MYEFVTQLFDSQNFMPHGMCLLWAPEVLWLHVVSDLVITISYFSIPCIIFYVMRKRKRIQFQWIYAMFGLFILLCGFTHILEVWVLWNPIYRFEGLIKAVTAGVSIATAFLLIPVIPNILELLEKSEQSKDGE